MGRRDLPAGTVTFLFTDVEGSTRLLSVVGSASYADALAEHRRVIREACTRHGGVEVDTQGDAFFVAFPTARGALDAAGAITAGLSSGPLEVRIGIHTGTPLVTDEGYVGPDVHRAARIAAAGHGGQVLVSASTAAVLQGYELRYLGDHRFKDLAAPERVYQLGDGDFPAIRSLYRTNLPVPATPFMGRDRELAEVIELLGRDGGRLLTLTGPGGIGKTRLALQAAAESFERYPDGVWWVPLAPVRDPALLPAAVAQALEVTEEPGTPMAETLRGTLTGKRALLLLDNLEHLLPDAADAVAALRPPGGPTILGSSRERLHLQGEQVYPVPTLDEQDAVALFVARANALDPGFEPDGAVADLCARLDNLPLALELAAARTAVFTPQQLLERLTRRLDLLKAERDADPRQRTLRATVEWSHDLLDASEQRLFRRLSVFAGGCTFESGEQVCGADADTLQSLIDKSLLRSQDSTLGRRYWMLETIREYAVEQLEASAEGAALRRRHATYFVELAERAAPELIAADQVQWLARLAADVDNFRTARTTLRDERASDLMLRLVVALERFWFVRGHLREASRWLDEALSDEDAGSMHQRAKALSAAGQIAYRLGAYQRARLLNDEAMAAFRMLGDRVGIGRALNRMADLAEANGDVDQADVLWRESATIARETGDEFGLAIATANLGSLFLTTGDPKRAATLTEESLRMFRSLGHVLGMAVALENLGSAAVREGRYRDAVPLLKESVVLFRQLDSPVYLAHSLTELAAVAAMGGDPVAAARLLGAVDAVLADTGGTLAPDSQKLRDHAVASGRGRVAPDVFDAALAEGAGWGLERALAYCHEAFPDS